MRVLLFSEEGIGNGILRTPVIKALRDRGARVDVVCSKRSFNAMSLCPIVEKVYHDGELIEGYYNFGIDCQFTSGLIARKYDGQCDVVLRAPREFAVKHEAMHNLELVGEMYNDFVIDKDDPEFWKHYGLSMMRRNRSQSPNVFMIHTGCLDTYDWRNRFWAEYNWAMLADKLVERYGMPVYFIGGEKEKARVDRILEYSERKHANLVGHWSLKDTIEAMIECYAFISLDSGIMHLAASQEIPQVALFGPTSDIKSHPWRDPKGYRIVRDETLECKRCHIEHPEEFKTCEDNKCMKYITPEMVVAEVEDLLCSAY